MVNPLSTELSNSSWPGDVMWWHRSGSTLGQIVACCLVATSHYLNQRWLIITERNFTQNVYNSGNETSDILYRPQCIELNWMLSQYHDYFCYYAASSWCIFLLLYVVLGFVCGCPGVLWHQDIRKQGSNFSNFTNIPVKYNFGEIDYIVSGELSTLHRQ